MHFSFANKHSNVEQIKIVFQSSLNVIIKLFFFWTNLIALVFFPFGYIGHFFRQPDSKRLSPDAGTARFVGGLFNIFNASACFPFFLACLDIQFSSHILLRFFIICFSSFMSSFISFPISLFLHCIFSFFLEFFFETFLSFPFYFFLFFLFSL
ncbi:unnamed protein product [Acanthosepion pharaonis]|uniref:Uncharacterized protein n=1 Tax=Acanthosepion pharaonis TaxID=158019 RepID=A0A812DWQ8_ACAPH|nr:unnamed protein product [Sepia pharaonis]